MVATKSGNNINVSGTGNTLASIFSDINDPTFFSRTDMGGWYKYTLECGSVARTIYVLDDAVLTIGNESDYSFREEFSNNPGASGRGHLQINTGGELRVFGNVTITFSESPTYYSYTPWCWYGKLYFRGNDTYRPKLRKIYGLYLFRYNCQAQKYYDHDIWDWDKVDIEDFYTPNSGAPYIQFLCFGLKSASFTNIHIIGHTGGGSNFSGSIVVPYSATTGDRMANVVLENWEVEHCYAVAIRPSGVKFKNSNFHDNWAHGATAYGTLMPVNYKSERVYAPLLNDFDIGQPIAILDSCVFTDNYRMGGTNTRGAAASELGVVLLENCTINASQFALYSGLRSTILIGDGNTFNAPTMVIWDTSAGCVLWVKKLTITVTDTNDNPIEGATITINQKDGKESWRFRTEADGTPRVCANMNKKILLVWREQTNQAGTTFTYWSDPSNNSYHEIIVSKPGYRTHVEQVVMNDHRTITVKLRKDTSRRTQGHHQSGFVPTARKAT